MKILYPIIFILLILFIGCCDNDDNPIKPEGWKKLTYKGVELSDIEFIDNDFGIVCGSFGSVLKT